MHKIQMVDLQKQMQPIKNEIQTALNQCLERGDFINGSYTRSFEYNLARYTDANYCIGCANGTDALQIALMATDLNKGDEVIVPTFTYVATAEVIALLGLRPVMVDVDIDTFNINIQQVREAITERTRAIVPVHLFGQSCDMAPILDIASEYDLWVIEDNAQAIGAVYTFPDGRQMQTGTMGHIGCTSFYPSKNLGAYGDGGAIFCDDELIAAKIRKIANHGQSRRYYHDVVGVNSRLDNMQAAILDIKLPHLDTYIAARQKAADYYDRAFAGIDGIITPTRAANSTHVFHQYTLRVPAEKRDDLQHFLQSKEVPSMVYYPIPLYAQAAFAGLVPPDQDQFVNTDELCTTVISLPMHTELDEEQLAYICEQVKAFI
jgi:UDP-2-acetamido-2-deoxy-ribo-hexuluronate aminotransferase